MRDIKACHFINVINSAAADYADSFWYMDHICPSSIYVYKRIETGSTVLFKAMNAYPRYCIQQTLV